MDEYPNPEEEYEMLHMEEMELMMEMERENLLAYQSSKPRKSKSSLNFDNVPPDDSTVDKNNPSDDSRPISNRERDATSDGSESNLKKRSNSLMDITSDLEIVENPVKKLKCDFYSSDNNVLDERLEYGTTSFRIPKWPFVTISTSQGERLYVKLNSGPGTCGEVTVPSDSGGGRKSSGLLKVPFSTLRALAEESYRKSLTVNEVDVTGVEGEIYDKTDLWVEKFKPKNYFDLLSDEAVNRTLLNWLKMWDKVVFNKEVKERNLNIFGKENDFKAQFAKTLDPDGRPHFKIALLCGPPGLGKTTLAHITAVMAGYNVTEVNASDDRSIEALTAKLDNATQMQAVMGKCKPNCLVLDEIDGAPTQTIEFLLKYIGGKCVEKSKKGKKETKPVKVVKRPIICICNELYTPSLRQLRQQAFVIHFPNTSSTKLTQRLMEICRKQDIKTDVTALTLLCDKAQNDIRSCISTLHFFKNKSGDRFKSTDVLKSVMGLKDTQKSIFSIWKEIFHNPIHRTGIFTKAMNKATEDEVSSHVNYSKKAMDRLQNIVQICQSSGEYERLTEGIYENFLKSKFSGGHDSIMHGLDWFCWFDMLDTTIKRHQNYALMRYLPYSFAMWQILYSSNSFWKINYPTAGYENRQKELKCNQILSDVSRGLNPALRTFNETRSLIFDSLPMIDIILRPPLRPVNPALFNDGEKRDFKHLIDVMVDFNLNYLQQRAVDGTYSYQLDPNIDELIKFNVGNVNGTRTHTYNMKQIISHELDLEKMRRAEIADGESGKVLPTSKPDQTANVPESVSSQPVKVPVLQPKEINIKETGQYKDFFGRVIMRKEYDPAKSVEDKNYPVKSPIWFSFKEGYNNAVKKDITMKDLL